MKSKRHTPQSLRDSSPNPVSGSTFRGAQLIALAAMLVLFCACQKEYEFIASDDAQLTFSADTLAFDTVFTHMGTTTRQVKVYNRGSEGVRIAEVTLAQGHASRFRLNVDGDTSMVARDIDIAAGDSIFIFVRANIRPDLSTEPFLIEDAIEFRITRSNVQRLPLTAYGRNAVYHVPTDTIHYADGSPVIDMYGKPYAYSVIDCAGWRHDLPHVILGYAVVDSRNTLTLTEGDELYFHNDAVLWVYDSATLKVQGTAEKPVLFTSVRHDGWYDSLPGQWGHIWISKGAWDSEIDHAVIENGFVGILVDSCANANPSLRISNTQIRNQSHVGLMGQTAYIVGNNLLVTNCGSATTVMQYGGRYHYNRCTFANYWRYETRKMPAVIITNYLNYQGTRYLYPMRATITDCIVYGNRADGEMLIDLDDRAEEATATVTHSIVRGGEWDEDPRFVAPLAGDFHLQEDSPAIGIGYTYPN
ncbi:MAG: hypothetical protein J6X88_09815 [Bacteroidales bacterium]|nr:hypothetical protein [Bacteroidales bacterium]